ncbi:MAG: UDP-N-acetylmuramoyl-L-alanyl-D-glutamate--2,6-diaminopimelate ligase [Lentimicrobiaceae bacterium]|nr:UDP-N-acetylmuramoyl-L-alanyl-D-glutamate--2,6-diaminopimelate ligase [Lentimicrobiaceae bacterium]
MKLIDLLSNIKYNLISESDLNTDIKGISMDSRQDNKSGLFVAVKGVNSDGHKYINKAIGAGNVCIVLQDIPEVLQPNIIYIQVDDTSKALGEIAANWYQHPSKSLKLVGVTGTNGKTTVVTLLYKYFMQSDCKAGLISTVENKIGDTTIPSTHTTPDSITLNKLLRQMVDSHCEYVFMEVSSHAMHQNRVYGLHFSGAVFTNLTHDHLDYHKTFAEYIKAKKSFFDSLPETAFAVSNIDDKNGTVVLQNTKAKKYYYSLTSPAEFKGKIIEQSLLGMQMEINNIDFWTRLVGGFNAYNLLAVYATLINLGLNKDEVVLGVSSLTGAPGRFEMVRGKDDIVAIIDYAHTPDALKNVIDTINDVRTLNEKLIVVFGCGGDRDHDKRLVMGDIASSLADKIIITSDNPRSEEPQSIINEILKGVSAKNRDKCLTLVNRREAIQTAVHLANKGDVILIAGKGHEKYQEVNGVRNPFDDKVEVENCLTKNNL